MTGDQAFRFDLPAGLTSRRATRLSTLVSQATGMPDAQHALPWLAPALLFADDPVQAKLAMPCAGPGEVLVQDYQAIQFEREFPLNDALTCETRRQMKGATSEFSFVLSDRHGNCATLDTALRQVPAGDLAAAKPAQIRASLLQDADCGPRMALSQDQIDTYLALSGDRNPIHADGSAGKNLGLRAPVVPGLLLISLIQPLCLRAAPGLVLRGLKARFTAPLCVRDPMRICLQQRGSDTNAELRRHRAYVLTEDDAAVAIADLVLTSSLAG